jgi:hypothetical protein
MLKIKPKGVNAGSIIRVCGSGNSDNARV